MLISHSADILAHRLALAEAHKSDNRLALVARHRADMALAAMHETIHAQNNAPETFSPPGTAQIDKRV